MNTLSNKQLLSADQLWERLLHDDQEAFVVLYRTYWADMYKAAYNVLKDRDQSLDIVQEIFTWLWEHRKQLNIQSSLKGYLLAAVKFKTANLIRNGKIRDDFFDRLARMEKPVDSNEAGSRLEVKVLEALIRQTVNTLPDRCRAIYRLSRNQNLSNREIAHELGISVKTVENQMTIALRRLQGVVARLFFL